VHHLEGKARGRTRVKQSTRGAKKRLSHPVCFSVRPNKSRPEVPGGISLPEGLFPIVEPKDEEELTVTDDVDTT
jgi:hypothetical protein